MGSRLVKLDEVAPGSKIVKDVVDARGNLLFKAGVELTPALIERIRARNVSHVFVDESEGVGMSEEELTLKQTELDSEIDAVFSDVADQPLMAELREVAKRFLKQKIK